MSPPCITIIYGTMVVGVAEVVFGVMMWSVYIIDKLVQFARSRRLSINDHYWLS